MDKNLDTATFAVSLIFKAVIIAAQYSGRIRKRSLKRLAATDIDEKDKENLFRPDDVYYDRTPKKPQRDSKTVPRNIQQHLFRETRVTGYRLKDVA